MERKTLLKRINCHIKHLFNFTVDLFIFFLFLLHSTLKRLNIQEVYEYNENFELCKILTIVGNLKRENKLKYF